METKKDTEILNELRKMDNFLSQVYKNKNHKMRLVNPDFWEDKYDWDHIENLIEDGVIKKIEITGDVIYATTRKGRMKYLNGGYVRDYKEKKENERKTKFQNGIIAYGTGVAFFILIIEILKITCGQNFSFLDCTCGCGIY